MPLIAVNSNLLDNSRRTSGATALVAMAATAAMLLGGSGSLIPSPEMALQCVLAGLTVAWVWLRPEGLRAVPRSAWIIGGLMLAWPLCQLVPMPAALWQRLPGRELEHAALDLVGQGSSWRPLSLTANRTLASLLAMVAAAAVLIMAAAQDRRGRTILLGTMAGVALLSVLVGAAQLSGGDDNIFRFYNANEAFLDGFQNNHNAEADVLLMGMVALAAVASDWAERRKTPVSPLLVLGMVGAGSLLLIIGAALTASRTGIALLPIAIGAQVLILQRWLAVPIHWGLRLEKRRLAATLIAALVTIVIAALTTGPVGALGLVWARFHTATELRPEIWRDAMFALRQYWPWGAGMGSFIPIFAAAERLDVVTGKFINRAHDDYLEYLIEAGLPGILMFGLICRQIVRHGARGWRARVPASKAQLICGAANLTIIMLHSLGDYPLRTLSISCMAAISAGLLLPLAGVAEPEIREEP